MIFEQQPNNPFQIQISFNKLIENLEEIARSGVDYRVQYAEGLIRAVNEVPELRTGITDVNQIEQHKTLIRYLLSDLFPTALTRNEIKAVTIPFNNITFNYSERFQHILNNAGPDFDMVIRDFDDDQFYIMSCCLILNVYYGYKFDFSRPFLYDIPDEEGIMKHYRILYNGDFLEVLPTERSIDITSSDVEVLIENFHDIDLWKQKFPMQSWILKGFGIMSLYDATTESAVSNLKTTLLTKPDDSYSLSDSFEKIFRSIFRIPDLRIGYTALNPEEKKFVVSPFSRNIGSFILGDVEECKCEDMVCNDSLDMLIKERTYVSIADVRKFAKDTGEEIFAQHLLDQNIQSAIFAPVIKNDKLLGIVEVVSSRNKELNSINAQKMDIVMPYIIDTIDRYYSDVQNMVDAMIQNEYTTIHPSVYWKFRDEALLHINDTRETVFHEIVFSDVYPLYGQIDIKGSSEMRNTTTKEDIVLQVNLLIEIFEAIFRAKKLPIFEQKIFELQDLASTIESRIKADSEQLVLNYIKSDINPILKKYKAADEHTNDLIQTYFQKLDLNSGTIYESRKKFDTSLSVINKKMSAILDKKQLEAQSFYPHYYERFKTDGVEHNLYIGKSITNQSDFDMLYLYNLRLWQLQVMCDMENQYHALKTTLPYQMEVTSLLLVFNNPITIRFRMDEKRFDVDGSYNARYEVVKKRIDKANIKGTKERITQKDKITIVYTQQSEEYEYKRYISFLQHKGRLGEEVEFFDVEDLQGVSGLKGIRVQVIFDEAFDPKVYSYQELLKEIEH
ncbi:GAF domain-containing protein [Flavobacterium sp.]|uniref:GAF domain-containing protein n=1 Tax=Flavobacterium sp. TaxID=239 RepID=UPI0039E71858